MYPWLLFTLPFPAAPRGGRPERTRESGRLGQSEEGAGSSLLQTGALRHPLAAGFRWHSPSQSCWHVLNNSQLYLRRRSS